MPMMIGKGGIFLNNRRLVEGDYHLVRSADEKQQPASSGYIDISGKCRDSLTEIFTWFDASPAGLMFASQNGGMLPVSRLTRDRCDLDAGTARFNIDFSKPANRLP